MFQDFKKFLMRGNVVDLAVAVVIGAAFGAVVTSLVDGIINPIVGLVGGKDLSGWVITLKDATATDPAVELRWGAVLSSIIDFVLIAAAIFFLIVKPMNAMVERRRRGEEPAEDTPAPSDEAVLLTEIRDLLAQRSS
ncbi:MAG TPA: large conductance mechanosensitive channel protein MscL [Acidimicrobiales bacterium]|nr:large conductance mechanosensitive channel protein MscL [Acidimicrobiales bacterium]